MVRLQMRAVEGKRHGSLAGGVIWRAAHGEKEVANNSFVQWELKDGPRVVCVAQHVTVSRWRDVRTTTKQDVSGAKISKCIRKRQAVPGGMQRMVRGFHMTFLFLP